MPRKRFGQHFLEPVWADKVIGAIAPAPEDVFLEIGAGPGVLTERLARTASRVVALEIDRDLARALAPRLPANATLVEGDVLEADLMAIADDAAPSRPVRIAGNLPYNISSPILFRLLELAAERPVVDATLMLQREVVDRIVAKPNTAAYGVLSICLQWRAAARKLLDIPPGAFRPPPAVRSALVRLAFRPPEPPVLDAPLFDQMVRRMFTRRRKTLANALAAFGHGIGVDAAAALAAAGIEARRRPETLEIVELTRLADAFATARR